MQGDQSPKLQSKDTTLSRTSCLLATSRYVKDEFYQYSKSDEPYLGASARTCYEDYDYESVMVGFVPFLKSRSDFLDINCIRSTSVR